MTLRQRGGLLGLALAVLVAGAGVALLSDVMPSGAAASRSPVARDELPVSPTDQSVAPAHNSPLLSAG